MRAGHGSAQSASKEEKLQTTLSRSWRSVIVLETDLMNLKVTFIHPRNKLGILLVYLGWSLGPNIWLWAQYSRRLVRLKNQ